MKSAGTSSAVYKEVSFDLKEFPHLNWRWMVTKLPKGADVRRRSADDQAIQVYVVFPDGQSRSTGSSGTYDSSTEPDRKERQSTRLCRRRAAAGVGTVQEKECLQGLQTLFNEEPPKRLTIMIDSDDTKSVAEAFVSDIYFSK
jgi:hypothetical protein